MNLTDRNTRCMIVIGLKQEMSVTWPITDQHNQSMYTISVCGLFSVNKKLKHMSLLSVRHTPTSKLWRFVLEYKLRSNV